MSDKAKAAIEARERRTRGEREPKSEELKKDELIAKAELAGVDASGTKAEIIERLEKSEPEGDTGTPA